MSSFIDIVKISFHDYDIIYFLRGKNINMCYNHFRIYKATVFSIGESVARGPWNKDKYVCLHIQQFCFLLVISHLVESLSYSITY